MNWIKNSFRLFWLSIWTAAAMLVLFGGAAAYGASVAISLPDFPVKLNAKTIDNTSREYPLIVYKGITYFPMTYHDSRFLGLESTWDQRAGLSVAKTEVAGAYFSYQGTQSNNGNDTAAIPTFAIRINGKPIDNAKEPYPLLNYRNITYFPLTWRFAVDEFGWEYSYSDEQGLIIHSGNEKALEAQMLDVPVMGDYAMAGDYLYYEGAEGIIYQSPLANPAQARAVFELPINTTRVTANFEVWNGEVFMFYHVGNAQGPNYQVQLHEDGSSTEIDSFTRKFGQFTLRTILYPIGGGNVLEIRSNHPDGLLEVNNVLCYTQQGMTESGGNNLFLLNDDIYLLAKDNLSMRRGEGLAFSPWSERADAEHYGIYKINANTGEATRLVTEVYWKGLILQDENMYFLDGQQRLCRADLEGKNLMILIDRSVAQFIVFGQDIYYCLEAEPSAMIRLSDGAVINPGAELWELKIKEGYLYGVFGDAQQHPPYEKVILDPSGHIVYQSGDRDERVLVHDERLYYIK